MHLPQPRGPLTTGLFDALGRAVPPELPAVPSRIEVPGDPLGDEDLQLALWTCYELHYRGFDGVPDSWEWHPRLIELRRTLEKALLEQLRREVLVPGGDLPVAQRLWALVDADGGPQLSRYLQKRATPEQFLEFAVHRSLYQLKEADPHSWAIPRLRGRAKAALIEIQIDEYGGGREQHMHSELYRTLLRGLGLSDEYGNYLDAVPAITLAISNVMSLFGLNRELRGALVGHLAAYEMTSSAPCRRYGKAVRRLFGAEAPAEFFDVHVTADALHEQLAAHDLCGGLAADEPGLAEDIVFGAAACLHVDGRFARHVLDRWGARQPSLRSPVVPARSPVVAAS
jgi:hypothetical protein